jgi:anti-anti-sigma factor
MSESAEPGQRWLPRANAATVYVEDSLRTPLGRCLRHHVRALLRGGEQTIVVDLARVSRIDAAGVGELVRAYNMAVAMNGTLRIERVTTRVRAVIERVGLACLFELPADRDVHRRLAESA